MSDEQERKGSPVPTRPGLDTQTITDILNAHANEHGTEGIVTYSQLSKAIGRKVTELRGLLMTARKNILKERNQLWIVGERGVGIKLATASESLDQSLQSHKAGGRKVAKSIGARGAVAPRVHELHETEKVQYATAGSLAHFLKAMFKPKARNRIKQRVLDTGKTIDANEVLALLADKT